MGIESYHILPGLQPECWTLPRLQWESSSPLDSSGNTRGRVKYSCHIMSLLSTCLHCHCVAIVVCCCQRQRWQRVRGWHGSWQVLCWPPMCCWHSRHLLPLWLMCVCVPRLVWWPCGCCAEPPACEAWWWEERVCVCIWLQVLFGYKFCLVTSSGKDQLRLVRPVFCWSLNFRNHERPKTRLQLWSLMVLRISGLGQSGSGSVWVFFQSWDWTSKHYI